MALPSASSPAGLAHWKPLYGYDKNEAIIKPIVVGNWVGTDWVVLSGLESGEKVIVDNVIKLRPGAAVAPHPAGEAPVAADKSKEAAAK